MPDVQVLVAPMTDGEAARPHVFDCSSMERGDVSWVHLAGELDLSTTPQLRRTLGAARLRARMVVLDMRKLVFIDTSGVHAIVDASIRARLSGRRLVLLRGPAAVDRVFPLTDRAEQVETADLDPGEPAVQVLLQLARAEQTG
jgi:anti-anti-sigma factor